jgi:hypothetical protein
MTRAPAKASGTPGKTVLTELIAAEYERLETDRRRVNP